MIRFFRFLFIIFIFTIAEALAFRVYHSGDYLRPGDFLFVVLIKEQADRNIKIYINNKANSFYHRQVSADQKLSLGIEPQEEIYYFCQGFDIQYSPRTWQVKIRSAVSNYQKNFVITPFTNIRPPAKVNFRKKTTTKLLLDRKKANAENVFFYPFFLADYKNKLWSGKWVYPVTIYQGITSGYGRRRNYNNGLRVSFHRGIDFRGKDGMPIRAANHGEVIYAGQKRVRGNIVIVKHGPYITSSYWHLKSIGVKKGDTVTKGQTIGEMGLTGLATGVHLHWEVRIKNTCVNGWKLFNLLNNQSSNTKSAPNADPKIQRALQLIGF